MTQWWYDLVHNRVEPDSGGPNLQRLGPFDTKEEAANALEIARKRNEQWDEDENEWNGTKPDQE